MLPDAQALKDRFAGLLQPRLDQLNGPPDKPEEGALGLLKSKQQLAQDKLTVLTTAKAAADTAQAAYDAAQKDAQGQQDAVNAINADVLKYSQAMAQAMEAISDERDALALDGQPGMEAAAAKLRADAQALETALAAIT